MITVSAEILPRNDLTYLAFRTSFLETLERIVLAQQITLCEDWNFGYLAEVPFLQHVAPQVQLDLLLDTWQRHIRDTEHEATLLDEVIVYSVCETAARLLRNDRSLFQQIAGTGPQPYGGILDNRLAEKFVLLHESLTQDADFLLINQFLDLPPREAHTLLGEFGLHTRDTDPLFDALGRWSIHSDFDIRSEELLTEKEVSTAYSVLSLYMPKPRTEIL